MSAKNETPALIAAFVVTASLLAGGWFWFGRAGGISLPLMGDDSSTGTTSGRRGGGESGVAEGDLTAGEDRPAPLPELSGAASFADVVEVPAGVFNYGGSTTWAPVRGQIDPIIRQTWPSLQLRYTDPTTGTPGSGRGIRMLLDGELAFSQSSRPLNSQELQEAQQLGLNLKEIPVAIEGLAIAVHPDLDLPGLTVENIQDIYTGRLTNWRDVGGPDLTIRPYSRRPEDGGTVEFFVDTVLAGQPLSDQVDLVFNTTEALRTVSATPGSIYYASAPEVVGQCSIRPVSVGRTANNFVPPYQEPYVPSENCPAQRNQPDLSVFRSGDYPITRRMFVIVPEDGSSNQQAGEAYANLLLSDQGQALLEQADFVRIR
jgi:phosphate transport system substrate-binding protein